jgi:hypothetical protein
MSSFDVKFTNNYLPCKGIPFFDFMEEIFCAEKIQDLSIHCPNIIRCLEDIMLNNGQNIVKDDRENAAQNIDIIFSNEISKIYKCLGVSNAKLKEKAIDTLRIAALYHDIGKVIRKDNHPRLGVNILRTMDKYEQKELVKNLFIRGDKPKKKSNEHRFSLLCSIVEHHDKFGVVSTGEGSLALFSDILYFRSDEKAIAGIKKNITSVMLLNLADIAAVCRADDDTQKRASELVTAILKNGTLDKSQCYDELRKIWEDKNSYLGLKLDKVTNILEDWRKLIAAAKNPNVLGSRTKLREYLMRLDQNPARTIKRIIRLIKESCYTTECSPLLEWVTETDIESTLVGFFGPHQFQDFCVKFAYVVKMDYGLKFFKGVVCACVRKKLDIHGTVTNWEELDKDEELKLEELSEDDKRMILEKISKIFIQVISGIIARYNSIFDLSIEKSYRFGLQMRNLTNDNNVREKIIDFLCYKENMDHIALTWIADEVTFWSMD